MGIKQSGIYFKGPNDSIVVMDSVAYMSDEFAGKVEVCGSHGGESAAGHVLKFKPGGVISNDAGKGKDNAGISGLKLCDDAGVPAVTVDAFSARIGDGMDTYESGIVSAVNERAMRLGISVGMKAVDAALLMLKECK